MADQRYKIYEQLGAGGNGAVYRAYDTQLKRWVAIKRLFFDKEGGAAGADLEELRREADTLASLRNPNIVTIFDVATDEEGLFMVMELLEGPDLADTIAISPLGGDDFKQLAEQTLEALLAAHQLRILHRDIKPENIKVERLPGGRLQSKLIDFGLARAGLTARKQTEDEAGSVIGSIYYMAPEQLSRQPTDVRTDLYSLGCVLYEALSSRKAFDGKSVNEVIDKHIDHDVVPLGQICPHLPHWMTYWVMRLMACKPEDRPSGAQQAIEEFRAWEKLPPTPQMMPWLPQGYTYPTYPQPGQPGVATSGFNPAATGHYNPSLTSPIPPHTTTYVVPLHQVPTQAPVPEPVPYALPVQEPSAPQSMAKPTPQRPAPRSPQSGPTSPPRKGKTSYPGGGDSWVKKNKMLLVVGGVVLGGMALFFLLRSPGGKASSAAATPESKPTPGPSGPSEAVEKDFPSDRPFPVVDHGRVAHYIARLASASGDTKSVTTWQDIAGRGKNTPLKADTSRPEVGPPRKVAWEDSAGVIKSGRIALHFSDGGKPSAMNIQYSDVMSGDFPFGGGLPGLDSGLTLAMVMQADVNGVPGKVCSVSSTDGKAKVSILVDEKKQMKAEFQTPSGKTSLTADGTDCTRPLVFLAQWNGVTGELGLRVRDNTGSSVSATGSLAAPSMSLHRVQLGRTIDGSTKAMVPEKEQFHGYIAELNLYAVALKPDQVALLMKEAGDHYLQNPKPKPLKERYTAHKPISGDPKKWKITASRNGGEAGRAVDGDTTTAWSTKEPQKPGQSFQIDLGSSTKVAGLVMDAAYRSTEFPREFKVESSEDGKAWAPVAEKFRGKNPISDVLFPAPVQGRFFRITQTGSARNEWQIFELMVLAP